MVKWSGVTPMSRVREGGVKLHRQNTGAQDECRAVEKVKQGEEPSHTHCGKKTVINSLHVTLTNLLITFEVSENVFHLRVRTKETRKLLKYIYEYNDIKYLNV